MTWQYGHIILRVCLSNNYYDYETDQMQTYSESGKQAGKHRMFDQQGMVTTYSDNV